jgi:uncharacterized protein YjiS (DUF1127 family)
MGQEEMERIINKARYERSVALGDFIVNMFKSLYLKYKQMRSNERTLDELQRLTDYELKDIGISRSDIHRVVIEASKYKKDETTYKLLMGV